MSDDSSAESDIQPYVSSLRDLIGTSAPKSRDSGQPILAFRDVCLPEAKGTFSLELMPGEVALFRASAQSHLPELANIAMGLSEPECGSVEFLGQAWPEMDVVDVMSYRGLIGRVYAPRGQARWLENQDLDENVMVAAHFREGTTRESVVERADEIGNRFGFDHLPQTRPAVTPERDLTRAQWVRAFLPEPLELLVLDRPGFGVREADLTMWAKEIEQAREEGAAVLWIDMDPGELEQQGVKVTHRFDEATGGI